jgi:PmbA protein
VTPQEALEVADRIVGWARAGEQVEAVVAWARTTEVRAHEGAVEHFVGAEDLGVGVRVVSGGRTGMSWAGVLDVDALEECLAEARDNAGFATPDPHAGLAEPDGHPVAALDLVDHGLAAVTDSDKVDLALGLDARIRGADARIVGHEGADYADAHSVAALASSTGVRAAEEETSTYAGVWALASDGADTTTGFGFDVGRGFDGLDLDEVVAEAVRRSTGLLGAVKPPSGRLTVVFDPYVCSQFLGVVAELLSGEEVLRGRSPFGGRVGEQVAAPLLTLLDDPLRPSAPTASATDGEGIACREVPLLTDGVLTGLLHNAYTARSMGTATTGSASRPSHRSAPGVGPRVVTPRPGRATAEQVMAEVGDGLLVQELSGLHSGVNPTSGDLSVGVEGRWLRGGLPAEPVREATIASTLQRMLADVVVVGSDLRHFPWESAGVTLAVADVTLSGT